MTRIFGGELSRKELRIPLCYRRFPVERTHAQHLRSFETFHALSDAVLEELAAETRVAEFGEGDRVWNAGDPTPYFTFVSRGLVQIVRANARGEEITLGIFGPGEGIGNLATMEGTPYPAAAVVVSKQCTLRRIPTAVMKASMQHSQGMLVSANRELMAKARALVTKIDMLSAGPIPARLALLFQHLVDRFGDETPSGGRFIPIVLTRGAMARLVGAREETVIRILSDWRQRGWVSTNENGFDVQQPSMLEAIVLSDLP